jgi:hypothetical protein
MGFKNKKKYCNVYTRHYASTAQEATIQRPLLGNYHSSHARNNRWTIGRCVFYAIRAEVLYAE